MSIYQRSLLHNHHHLSLYLTLQLYLFDIIGMQLFAKTAYFNSYNERANFRSFYRSLLLLIRFATFDNWNGFMYDLAHHRKECDISPVYDPKYCGFNGKYFGFGYYDSIYVAKRN